MKLRSLIMAALIGLALAGRAYAIFGIGDVTITFDPWVYNVLTTDVASPQVNISAQAFSLINGGTFCCTANALFPGWIEPGQNSSQLAHDKVQAILQSYETIAGDAQTQLHVLSSNMQLEHSQTTTPITELRINTAVGAVQAQLLADLIALETTRAASDLNWQAQEQARNAKFEDAQP